MTSHTAARTPPPPHTAKLQRLSYSIDIDPADPKSVEAALRTEWLLTNGLGGYAMGTALGVNTRRYHGLFIAAASPPVGRYIALHSTIEQLIVPRDDDSEEVIELSTQQFVGGLPDCEPMLHPSGIRYLRRFETDGVSEASWTFNAAGAVIIRTLRLQHSRNVAGIDYRITDAPRSSTMRVRPLASLRDFHSLASEHAGQVPIIATADEHDAWCALPSDNNDINLSSREAAWQTDQQWWRRFHYTLDRERGQDFIEDVWSPGAFIMPLSHSSRWFRIEAGTTGGADMPTGARPAIGLSLPRDCKALAEASDNFVVSRKVRGAFRYQTSVIAGYPWFGDWGRDTMIALPGLMLTTGRFDAAQSTLECFAKHLRNGLIPNLFDDYGGAAHYNTVDASLWFVHAVHAYLNAQSPSPKGRGEQADLLRACRDIIAAYRNGTDYSIFMDADGLISAGDQTTQLTWMDAARDGVVFTPRFGKAVEINALWHNALICLSELSDNTDERNDLLMLARRVAASFRSAFWWDEHQCLHDCLVPAGEDASGHRQYKADGKLRPNQIFAASLPFSPLNDMQKRSVVKVVGDRLLTPFGLRTLDRDDPNYKPRYEGNLFARDAAYHNGTVWPWLLGSYCEALLRVENFSTEAKIRVRSLLQPLIDEMSNASGGRCLGQIAEVYDGDAPHRPSGCPAQAWSVAETLRAWTLANEA